MPMFSADLPSIDIHKRDSTILNRKEEEKFKENSMKWILMCIVRCLLWNEPKTDINNKYRTKSEGMCSNFCNFTTFLLLFLRPVHCGHTKYKVVFGRTFEFLKSKLVLSFITFISQKG